jgi:hypothetical protein
MKRLTWLFPGILIACVPVQARAQIAWDSPMLLPPNVQPGVGIYIIDVEGGDVGAFLDWRSPGWNFGVRVGVADGGRGDDIGIFGGIDMNGPLARETADFPLEIDWVFGAGIGLDDGVRISIPLGLSVGHRFQNENATFLPYATPRVVLDAFLGDDDRPRDEDDDDNDLRFEVALDLGLDLRVTQNFLIRFGATVGDRDGVALGLVF